MHCCLCDGPGRAVDGLPPSRCIRALISIIAAMLLSRLTGELCAGAPSSRDCWTDASNGRALVETVLYRPFALRAILGERLEPLALTCSVAVTACTP